MSGFLGALGNDLLLGLKVLLGMGIFGACVLGFALVYAAVGRHLPRKCHRPPRRVWYDLDEVLPQDDVVRLVPHPEIVNEITSDAVFDQDEWEVRYNGVG